MDPETTNLLIIGASSRSAAQCAKREGFSVRCADQFLDRDLLQCGTTLSWDELLACAQNSPTELHKVLMPKGSVSIPASNLLLPAGGTENLPTLLRTLHQNGIAMGVQGEMIRELRSIDRWRSWATASGLKFPFTIKPDGSTGIWQSYRNNLQANEWLVKAEHSAGGLGVSKWQGEWLPTESYLQKYIAGTPIGVTFLSDRHESYLFGACEAWTANDFWAPTTFAYRGNFGPLAISRTHQKTLIDFANRVRDSVPIRGLWNADFVLDERGNLFLLEINPRWSASMELIESAYQVRLIKSHIRAVMGERIENTALPSMDQIAEPQRLLGKRIEYASSTFTPTHALREFWWQHRWDGIASKLTTAPKTADIPNTDATIEEGWPILSWFASANQREALRLQLANPHHVCTSSEAHPSS